MPCIYYAVSEANNTHSPCQHENTSRGQTLTSRPNPQWAASRYTYSIYFQVYILSVRPALFHLYISGSTRTHGRSSTKSSYGIYYGISVAAPLRLALVARALLLLYHIGEQNASLHAPALCLTIGNPLKFWEEEHKTGKKKMGALVLHSPCAWRDSHATSSSTESLKVATPMMRCDNMARAKNSVHTPSL